LETTKSTLEFEAPGGGYVVGMAFQAGETVRAGELLCYLAASPDWQPPSAPAAAETPGDALPAGLRISQPALALARARGVDLSRLPRGPLVTEGMVRALAESAALPEAPLEAPFDPTALVIYGGGGHGKALIDLIRSLGSYRIAGVLDDGIPAGKRILDVPVLGGADVLKKLARQGVRLAVNAVGGIGNVAIRIILFERLAHAGFTCPALIHPAAWVEPSATVAPGAQLFAHAYLGSSARLGYGAIVNTGAIVSHDCIIEEYANVSPGAMLAGGVHLGRGALVGMGVTINLEVKIGAGARIGNGATVKADVPENAVVRAGSVW
ncbi:MAG: NeuD/PglB/VioB family sugar acetyltransferase, partial [Chloroflexi bacterium]|nr:NeuD/PglB/VioB family sugar acetyltransferase [Chloroflexota bacterium]